MKKARILVLGLMSTILITPTFAETFTKESANKLMMKSGCMTCHSIDTAKIGPAYKDIAKHYAAPDADTKAYLKGEAPLEYLMKKVRIGTKVGVNKHWLKTKEGRNYGMMTPNSVARISDANLRDLITFILSLK